MKTICAQVSDNLHAEIKIYACKQGKTVRQLILELLKKELQKENE